MNTTQIPNHLWEYLGSHLKVMATIADSSGVEQWGVFFGNSWSNDLDYVGPVETVANGKRSWKTQRPICLLPLTEQSRNLALTSLKEDRDPEIICSVIKLRNSGKADTDSNGTIDWNDYEFWYKDKRPEEWNADTDLYLTPETQLKALHPNGSWRQYGSPVGNQSLWPVWTNIEKGSDNPTKKFDRLIVFPAPPCEIASPNGEYLVHEIWFGNRVASEVKKGFEGPFIGIDQETPVQEDDGDDCPIVWYKRKRNDDLPIPAVNARLGAQDWVQTTPFNYPVNAGARVSRIEDDFSGTGFLPDVASWLVSEDEGESFGALYTRRSNIDSARSPSLNKILYNESGTFQQNIKLIQVCRGSKSALFVWLGYPKVFIPAGGDQWNKRVGRIKEGLAESQAGMPVGIVPRLVNLNLTNNDAEYISQWEIVSPGILDQGCSTRSSQVTLKETAVLHLKKIPEYSINNKIELPLLRPDSSFIDESTILLTNCTVLLHNQQELVNDNGTIFQFALSKYELKKGIVLQDGALSFALAEQLDIDRPAELNIHGRFRLTLQNARSQTPFFLWQWHDRYDDNDKVVLNYAIDGLDLPVFSAYPGGQDLIAKDRLLAPATVGAVVEGAGERSESALIIPLIKPDTPPIVGSSLRYLLTFSESVNVGQNHRMDVKLQEYNPAAGQNTSTTMTAVVLDANPQFTSLIQARFLQQPGYDDGAWVLARRSPLSEEAGGWELLDDQAVTAGFVMALPAQAIGEAYVRGSTAAPDAVPAPAQNPEPGEPGQNERIDYRFGQPTLLRISPERLDRRYVVAPWNVRSVFANTGSAAPGVPLREAQWELLYGLQGHMIPEKAFIAELAAKLGEVPVPPVNSIAWAPTGKQENAFQASWQQHLRFYRAWQSRLGILEPMVDDDFGKGVFSKEVSYNLRIKLQDQKIPDPEHPGRTKPALNGKFDRIGAELRNPVDPDQCWDKQEVVSNPIADPKAVYENQLRAIHDKDGLAGGAVYGFESKAIYRELLREVLTRGSSSGELKDPAFSSLGGWGRQTARFARDKTVIKATTVMGRTHFYSVERIGRIGVLWHRAKHVIEYERTVVPSNQFAPYQPQHYGRPLIRKVREYVEILEPLRSYPDYPGQPQDAPGSVMGCTFKSKIIPVLSAWGSDVFENAPGGARVIGWQVPLWKANEDLKIYPKPLIIQHLLPPPGSAEQAVLVNMDEPENLWFFTDTREYVMDADGREIPITADTNTWPAVLEVDYTNLPEPPVYDIAPARASNLELPMPNVPDILPGFERFTFRVSRAEIPASVAARYYPGSGITGRMRTASMMRSRPKSETKLDEWQKISTAHVALHALMYDPNGVLKQAANGFASQDEIVDAGGPIPDIDQYKNTLVDKLNNAAGGQLPALLHGTADNRGKLQFIYFTKEYTDGINSLKYPPTQGLWRQVVASADSLVNQAMGLYARQEEALMRRLAEAISVGYETSKRGEDAFQELLHQVDELHSEISGEVKGAYNAYYTAIAKVSKGLQQQVAKAAVALKNAADNLNDTRPLDQLRADASTHLNTYDTQVKTAVDTSIAILAELDKLFSKQPFATLGERIKTTVKALHDKLNSAISDAGSTPAAYLANVRKAATDAIEIWAKEAEHIIYASAEATKEFVAMPEAATTELLAKEAKVWSKVREETRRVILGLIVQWQANAADTYAIAKKQLDDLGGDIQTVLTTELSALLIQSSVNATVTAHSLITLAENGFDYLKEYIVASLLHLLGGGTITPDKVSQWLSGYDAYKELETAIKSGDRDAILKKSVALANLVNDDLGRLTGEVASKVRDIEVAVGSGGALMQTGQQTLTNFRSVWEEFTAPGMGLNRKTVALLVRTDYKDAAQRLSLTPAITRLKQFGSNLEGLGLRLPVVAITDQLLAAKKEWNEYAQSQLGKFNFSDILSDIGGMRLDKLFPGFKMPEFARDKIKITQGFDKEQLMAWADAEIDLKLDEKLTLMNIGPLGIELQEGLFRGKVHLQVDIDGQMKKTNSGELRGSFVIGVSGTPIMMFKDAAILYRDDKLSFDLDPKRMEMPGLLKILTDASKTISDTGAAGTDADGDTIETFKVGILKIREIPAGVRAELNIPPITVSGGVSGISNLSFGGHFLLSALDDDLNFRFLLGLGFYLGKKEAPFNIIIFFLGGGGYVDCALTFSPDRGLAVDFSMSILASASVAFSVGWAQGFVLIAVGFEMEYHKPAGGHGNAYLSLYVLIIGKVDILSLVTIYVSLLLQATYRAIGGGGSELVGTGRIRASIKVCRFLTIKVNKSFQKKLA
jgi:hypothetical protein